MATKRNKKGKRSLKKQPKTTKKVKYLLEKDTLLGLRQAKNLTQALLQYHWDYYAELAYQRNAIRQPLLDCLNENCISDFEFKKWQRAVKWKYSLHPLSGVGSLSPPGGRFNIGEINPNIMTCQPIVKSSAR